MPNVKHFEPLVMRNNKYIFAPTPYKNSINPRIGNGQKQL